MPNNKTIREEIDRIEDSIIQFVGGLCISEENKIRGKEAIKNALNSLLLAQLSEIVKELDNIIQPNEDRADFMGDDYVDIDKDLRKFLHALKEKKDKLNIIYNYDPIR